MDEESSQLLLDGVDDDDILKVGIVILLTPTVVVVDVAADDCSEGRHDGRSNGGHLWLAGQSERRVGAIQCLQRGAHHRRPNRGNDAILGGN